jgi:hypothetical protein
LLRPRRERPCCRAAECSDEFLVVLLGQKKAVAIAVRNVSGRRRWSKLREWLLTKEQDQLHRYQ